MEKLKVATEGTSSAAVVDLSDPHVQRGTAPIAALADLVAPTKENGTFRLGSSTTGSHTETLSERLEQRNERLENDVILNAAFERALAIIKLLPPSPQQKAFVTRVETARNENERTNIIARDTHKKAEVMKELRERQDEVVRILDEIENDRARKDTAIPKKELAKLRQAISQRFADRSADSSAAVEALKKALTELLDFEVEPEVDSVEFKEAPQRSESLTGENRDSQKSNMESSVEVLAEQLHELEGVARQFAESRGKLEAQLEGAYQFSPERQKEISGQLAKVEKEGIGIFEKYQTLLTEPSIVQHIQALMLQAQEEARMHERLIYGSAGQIVSLSYGPRLDNEQIFNVLTALGFEDRKSVLSVLKESFSMDLRKALSSGPDDRDVKRFDYISSHPEASLLADRLYVLMKEQRVQGDQIKKLLTGLTSFEHTDLESTFNTIYNELLGAKSFNEAVDVTRKQKAEVLEQALEYAAERGRLLAHLESKEVYGEKERQQLQLQLDTLTESGTKVVERYSSLFENKAFGKSVENYVLEVEGQHKKATLEAFKHAEAIWNANQGHNQVLEQSWSLIREIPAELRQSTFEILDLTYGYAVSDLITLGEDPKEHGRAEYLTAQIETAVKADQLASLLSAKTIDRDAIESFWSSASEIEKVEIITHFNRFYASYLGSKDFSEAFQLDQIQANEFTRELSRIATEKG
ncbi:MAG: hypothetical protein KDD53_06400, partial [Bdellovibrionales bacterium]|nr:hypothetical protein [Bdellovibrionales bacterium]